MNQDIIEIREAIVAGERALNSLYAAQGKLKSAKGWGIFDILGGGLLSDLMKHSRMNDASSYMEAARRDLEKFKREELKKGAVSDSPLDTLNHQFQK